MDSDRASSACGGVPHMTAGEFRTLGRRMVDVVAEYLESVEKRPVGCGLLPGEVMAKLPESPPARGESWEAIFGDIERVIMPGLLHWQSPGFFGYFPSTGSGPAILGDLLSTGLGVQGMMWATSPACTEIETRVLDWLGGMIGLPESFLSTAANGGGGGGVIQSTASEATLVSLLAARHRERAKTRLGEPGHLQCHFTLYTSTQGHSSVVKAAMIAGLASGPEDRAHVRLIETDAAHAMRPEALASAIDADVRAGRTPIWCCATVGTTSSTAIDPLGPIGAVCEKYGVWMHVDAAYAGAACVCPEFRWMIDGVERADSFCFNPHKWLLTSFDCSCMWTRDRGAITGALSITPDYLNNAASASGRVFDYRDWQAPLGRRFRALKLWFVIRHYGVEGLQAFIRHHVRLAALFDSLVRGDERFEVSAPRTPSHQLGLVCFRLKGRGGGAGDVHADAMNKALLERINASGEAYLSHTILPSAGGAGVYTLRMAIGSTMVDEVHVRGAWRLIERLADEVLLGK